VEKNMDFGGYSPLENMNNLGFDSSMNDIYKEPMFNPIMQYEQAYMYYRYLSMQMDYKIKCKEYEKLCDRQEKNNRRIE